MGAELLSDLIGGEGRQGLVLSWRPLCRKRVHTGWHLMAGRGSSGQGERDV